VPLVAPVASKHRTLVTIVTQFVFLSKQETLSRFETFKFFTFLDNVIAATEVASKLFCEIADLL
jgi:hypothetical protein